MVTWQILALISILCFALWWILKGRETFDEIGGDFIINPSFFTVWYKTRKYAKLTEYVHAFTSLRMEAKKRWHELVRQEELLTANHEHALEQVAASISTQRTVEKYGTDPVTIGRIIEKQESDKSEVQKEDGLSRIRTKERRINVQIDNWLETEKANREVQGALIADLAAAYEIEKLTEKFSNALAKWEEWYLEPESQMRTLMLKRLSDNAKIFNEAIDGKGFELVSPNSRGYEGSVETEPSDTASETIN